MTFLVGGAVFAHTLAAGATADLKISVFAKFIRQTAAERNVSKAEAADMLYAAGVRGYDCGPDEDDLDELAATCLKPVNFYYFPDWFGRGLHDWNTVYADRTTPSECIAKAKRHGIPRIMVVPPDFTDGRENEREFKTIVDRMRTFVSDAKVAGIAVTVETFGGTANCCSYVKYLKRLLAEVPDLAFALDSGNLHYAGRGEDVLEMMAFAEGRIGHVHLKDLSAEDNRRYVTLGLGAAPNETIVKALVRAGYEGWYTLENPVGDTYNDTVRQVALLRSWIAEGEGGKKRRLGHPADHELAVLPEELWWGAGSHLGTVMPFDGKSRRTLDGQIIDLRTSNYDNQTAPLLLSNRGRYLWSDRPFALDWTNGVFRLVGDGPFDLGVASERTLRGAFLAAAARHFPPSGRLPDEALFAAPQWNTWVELTYNQNQKDILAYANAVRENGFPGGVLMIDDTWQYDYGIWEFDPRRFDDPKGMVDRLHADGWKVMLWICPYVSMDSPGYREMSFGRTNDGRVCEKGGLLLQGDGNPAAGRWWNGCSAVLDLTHPRGARHFLGSLQRLHDEVGVDGWKFDAGDVRLYERSWRSHAKGEPVDHCEAYAKIGLAFPLNEYRACWKMGGQPIVQRLCDKGHDWESVGMLIPDMIALGLLGHPFVCPDMIGSGKWTAFSPDAPAPYDPEIFVRSAQIHALCPMMQFSAAPWRLLDGRFLSAVREAAELRTRLTPYILKVARASARSGEPMLRAMEYSFPGHGWGRIGDQFMMGDDLLVAPQTKKGAVDRDVVIPPGCWQADDGAEYRGPRVVSVETPLNRLPHFFRVRNSGGEGNRKGVRDGI